MPSDYKILAARGVVYVRHSGRVTVADAMAGLGRWRADPAFDASHSALVDCSAITAFEEDPVAIMRVQAALAEVVVPLEVQPLLVLFAGRSGPGRRLAEGIRKSWDGIGLHQPRIALSEVEALDILGLGGIVLAGLLESPG